MRMATRPGEGERSLFGYWDVVEGVDDEAGDSSGNGNDGRLGLLIGEDGSDPAWVDSDVPFRCSLEGVVERNLSDIWDSKLNILDQLSDTIEQEEALWEYVDTVFKDRTFGTANKRDVVKSKQNSHTAIQHEEQADSAIERSVDNLEDEMHTLGIASNLSFCNIHVFTN